MDRRLTPLMRHSVRQFRRDRVLGRDGPAGSVADLYFEDEHWKVRYLVLNAGSWLMPHLVLISPASVDVDASGEGALRLALTREEIRSAPRAESARPAYRQLQLAQAVHFGYPYYWSGLGLWGAVGGGSRADAERAAHAELARGDPHLRSAVALTGCRIETRDGPLGVLHDFAVDERDWRISDLAVDTRRWRPGGRVRVDPALVRQIDWAAHTVRLSLTREALRRSPRV
jgi:hypothetical protein